MLWDVSVEVRFKCLKPFKQFQAQLVKMFWSLKIKFSITHLKKKEKKTFFLFFPFWPPCLYVVMSLRCDWLFSSWPSNQKRLCQTDRPPSTAAAATFIWILWLSGESRHFIYNHVFKDSAAALYQSRRRNAVHPGPATSSSEHTRRQS